MKQEKINSLRKDFEKAVTAYTDALCEQFGISPRDTWWVRNRIGTGTFLLDTFFFGDVYPVSLSDIIYIVEQGITYEEYTDYLDYNSECTQLGLYTLNLESYHNGAPRVRQETFDRLHALRDELQKQIDEQNGKDD